MTLWRDHLGHPGSSMMRKIVESTHGHSLKNHGIYQVNLMFL